MFDFSAADTAMLAAIGAHTGDAGTIDSSKTLPSILRKRNRKNDDTMRHVTIGPTTAVTYRPGLPYRFNELNRAGRGNSGRGRVPPAMARGTSSISISSDTSAGSLTTAGTGRTTGTTHAALAKATAALLAEREEKAAMKKELAAQNARMDAITLLLQQLQTPAFRTDTPPGSNFTTGPTNAGDNH
jgi:hypothetical protein